MKQKPAPKIERGVPFSPYRDNRCSAVVKNMKPGDSVLVESHSKATGYITAGQRRGFRMASRKEGDGVRVWRLDDGVAIGPNATGDVSPDTGRPVEGGESGTGEAKL